MQTATMAQQESDEQASHTAIAIEKWVYGLELRMR